MSAELSPDQRTVTVSVPLAVRRRGARKQVVAPEGAPAWTPRRREIDSMLVKALARAFRWRRLLEDGIYASCNELAAAERINGSYVSRVLRLTLLAPKIIEKILNGRHPPELTMARLVRPFPVEWQRQGKVIAGAYVRFGINSRSDLPAGVSRRGLRLAALPVAGNTPDHITDVIGYQ